MGKHKETLIAELSQVEFQLSFRLSHVSFIGT
jgi:hypothetical protein